MDRVVAKCVLLLIITQSTRCEDKSSSLEVSPISFPASESWYVASTAESAFNGGHPSCIPTKNAPRDGNDGPWSSFDMQIGTPPQILRLLPSSSGNAIWSVLPQGCNVGDPSNCGDLRGTIFLPNASSTWIDRGLYGLILTEEAGLGYSGNANFGYDNITLGWPGGGLPTLSRQVIEGYISKDFYIGSFGLNPAAVNISSLNDPQLSFLGALAQQNRTPSSSWAYTAGAYYRQPTAFGSLTLGGYDTTRLVENNVTFEFGPDTSRDLIVPIQSITSDAATSPLLSEVIYAYIDSLVPHIWLPLEMCKAFERTFDLIYNETAEMYFVNATLHDRLVSQNPNVTFTLGLPGSTKVNTVDVVMHYGSFDLMAEYPIVNNATRYFPLKQAQNHSQYILGRAFLQDAYVIADYDRSNFSVSQAIFPNGSNTQQIVAIRRPGDTTPSLDRMALSTGDIIVIAVAVTITFFIVIAVVIRYRLRRKIAVDASRNSSGEQVIEGAGLNPEEGETKNTQQTDYLEMPVTEPRELATEGIQRLELPAQSRMPVYEMPEPTPELGDDVIAHTHQDQGY